MGLQYIGYVYLIAMETDYIWQKSRKAPTYPFPEENARGQYTVPMD